MRDTNKFIERLCTPGAFDHLDPKPKKFTATKFKENGEIESWEVEAENLEEAKDSVLEDENLHVEEKE